MSAPITEAVRPRTSSAGSGFFLLGIIDEPVENASATRTNPNRGFDHQVSSSARRLRWTIASAAAASELDDEVAVRDGVERVRRDRRRSRAPRPSSRGRAGSPRPASAPAPSGEHVGPAARVGEPATVALEHLDVGEQVVGEQDRLGRLDVGRPGQDGVALALGELDERPLEADDRRRRAGRSPGAATAAGPSRPGRCASGRCGACRRPAPTRAVSSVSRLRWTSSSDRVPGDRARLDVERAAPPARPRASRPRRSVSRPGAAEAADVRDRPRDVVERQLGVDVDRSGEVRHPRVRLVVEPAAPDPHAPSAARWRHRTGVGPGRQATPTRDRAPGVSRRGAAPARAAARRPPRA